VTAERKAAGWRRISARDRNQRHRASTPLELLFDLCFVVAVAQAGGELHHALAEGRAGTGALAYLMVMFAIWWAWMNFTWFASAYDNDDLPYRLLTFVQIGGGLILAAGVPAAVNGFHLRTVTIGYVVMRVAMISQWTRVAVEYPTARVQALRYVAGIGLVQAGWVARLLLPGGWGFAGFFVLAAVEVLVPVWADRDSNAGRWHPEHIAERYGLFTLIVLGESVAAATVAIQQASRERGVSGALIWLAVGALLLIVSSWWLYFDHPAAEALRNTPRLSFLWGYGHYLVFAGMAAVGAGLQLAAETVTHPGDGRGRLAALAVAVPVAVVLVVVGGLQGCLTEPRDGRWFAASALTAVVTMLIGWLVTKPDLAVPLMGLALAGLAAYDAARSRSMPQD
jgi:low temperature requirement protein LtrA